MSSSESVDCIFQFFGEGQQFAVVKEYTFFKWSSHTMGGVLVSSLCQGSKT